LESTFFFCLATSAVSISQTAENDLSESKSISTTAQLPSGQEPVRVPVPALPDPQESSSPQRKKPRIDCPGEDNMPLNGTTAGSASGTE